MRRYVLLLAAASILFYSLGLCAQARKSTTSKTPQKKATAGAATPSGTREDGSDSSAPVKEDLKRLILTDGSYQAVIKYQLIGARVHYLSAERYAWEDIPSSLIDWDASRKFAAEAAAENTRAKEIDAIANAEKEEDDANTPTVSPGVKLPPTGGVFLLDVYQDKPELNELAQSGADVNKNKVGNILRATVNPLASAKQTVVLKGAHAKVQSHVGDPFIFVFLDTDKDSPYTSDPTRQQDHWRIVKLEEKKGDRIVGNVNIAMYGKVKEKAEYVNTEVTPVSGRWIKIAPAGGGLLPPGEYAIVELLDRENMNRFVWDFGVNPNAPANTGVWRAQPVKQGTVAPEQKPTLDQRQKQ